MLVFIKVPMFGTDIVEAQLVEWAKEEGDIVSEGDEILYVETSKAVFTVTAAVSGKLLKIFYDEGETVKIHLPVGVIGTEDSDHFDESDLDRELESKKAQESVRYGKVKLEQTTEETENSVKKNIRLSPRAKRYLKKAGVFSEKWAMSHFIEGTIQESDIRALINREPAVCIGAGPGIVRAFEIIRRRKDFKIVEILDDNSDFWGKEILGVPVKRGLLDFSLILKELGTDKVYVSVFSEARIALFKKIEKLVPEAVLLPLIDPRANIGTGVVIEKGVLIEAGVTIGTNAHIGKGARVNIGAMIAHDSLLEPFVHVAPGGILGGKVYVGANTLIGLGATVNAGVVIGKNCIVSNSSAVLSDIDDKLLVVGNPASVISESKREYDDE